MHIDFSDLFSRRGERLVAKHLVMIGGVSIPPGVTLKGLNLDAYQDKLLHGEVRNGVYEVKGYYTYHQSTR